MVCIFRNELNKINNTKARMSDSIYHTTFDLLIPRSRGGGGGGSADKVFATVLLHS